MTFSKESITVMGLLLNVIMTIQQNNPPTLHREVVSHCYRHKDAIEQVCYLTATASFPVSYRLQADP